MAEEPSPALAASRPGTFWERRRWTILSVLWLGMANVLFWTLGSGDPELMDLAPRPMTIPTRALWYLAVLSAMGLAWAMIRTLPYCFRMVVTGEEGWPGPLLIVGSLSTCVLCWALFDFRWTPSAIVLPAGFLLTDGAFVLGAIWNISVGRLLRSARGTRQTA
ncbi:MAG: hypothetical protein L6R43_11425 [Planctomycetes bacterium]|nr:hypothetical protein [Planctomycetota bacterium]